MKFVRKIFAVLMPVLMSVPKVSVPVVSVVLVALLAAGCSQPDHSALYQELKSANKLVLASMAIKKTVTQENPEVFLLGKRVAVYSFDTYMQAYINLSELEEGDLVFDEDNRRVTVTLPPVHTELAGRDMQMRKVYENIGLLRADLDSKERAWMKEKGSASLRREVEKNPEFRKQLDESARNKARSYFESLMAEQGYTADVRFRDE